MLSDQQWERIRRCVDEVIDRNTDLNGIADDDNKLAVDVRRGKFMGSIDIVLHPTVNWNLEPEGGHIA